MSAGDRIPAGVLTSLREEGDSVPFARFMQLALTHPEEGYYSSGPLVLGPSGDFTTAPHRTAVVGRALGRFLAESACTLIASGEADRVEIVELGGGEGDLATALASLLAEWPTDLRAAVSLRVEDVTDHLSAANRTLLLEARHRGLNVALPGEGSAVEISSAGRAGPAAATPCAKDTDGVATRADPAGGGRDPVKLIISNELVDALPVHIVDVRGACLLERYTRVVGEGTDVPTLRDEWRSPSEPAANELVRLFVTQEPDVLRRYTRDGFIELRPAAHDYLTKACATGERGFVLTIDYGGWLDGPHHPSPCAPPSAAPHARSLRCYLRHRQTVDPYLCVGRQDVTADVDFRALAVHGAELGFECVLYTSLAAFLKSVGTEEAAETLSRRVGESLDADREFSSVSRLLDDADVGGLFKVMLQVLE